MLNNLPLTIGSQFTQEDIDNGKISYAFTANGISLPADDGFNYMVKDTEGGWLGINRFNIRINTSTATQEETDAAGLQLFPNPANQRLHFSLSTNLSGFNKYKLCTLTGTKMVDGTLFETNGSIDLSQFEAGMYIFTLSNGQRQISQK